MSYDYADSEVDASVIADLRKRVAELETALRQAAAPQQGRETIVAAMCQHFKSIVERSASKPFAETDVYLPVKSFEGYADAILARTPAVVETEGREINDRMISSTSIATATQTGSELMAALGRWYRAHHHGTNEEENLQSDLLASAYAAHNEALALRSKRSRGHGA